MTRYGLWKGIPLEDYSKEELVEIIINMNQRYLKVLDDMRNVRRRLLEY